MRQALEYKNYEIVKSIGKGAFGEVVLARNSRPTLIKNRQMSLMQSKLSAKCILKKNHSYKNTLTKKSIS
jgi:hypothetical protein